MFKNLINKWKEEWLSKRADQLEKEFHESLSEIKSRWILGKQDLINSWEEEEKQLKKSIELKKTDISDLEKRVQSRIDELNRENENLKEQIRLIEAKSSPSSIWESAVQTGWLMAWDSMKPIMADSIERQKNLIEQNAVEDTLKRISRSK